MHRGILAVVGIVLAACVAAVQPAGALRVEHPVASGAQVVVPRGQPIQIVVAVDDTGFGAVFGPSARNAVRMAIERHPTIHGFPIQVNAFNAPCDGGSAASLAANVATANAVVDNAQNVAVIGHPCSAEALAWLPIYERAGIVTINGSTTRPYVPAFGPTVFDRTAVTDPAFDAWYAAVKGLSSDAAWRQSYQAEFGSAPTDFADLYFDAATVLLRRLHEVSTISRGNLVIDRAALARAVRNTTDYEGVTCAITLDPATGNRVNDPAALARCRNRVVVPRGQSLQLAFVGSSDFPDFTTSFRNALQMATERHATIRGFPVQVNAFDAPCFSGSDPAAANADVAAAVVSSPQNTAVIGQVCSVGFAGALPIYDASGVVTISGSASSDSLPVLGPSVFNRTVVSDGDGGDSWYQAITKLPSDLTWRASYQAEFGAAPMDFTDLYFDAATLLLRRLQQVSRIVNGDLVIDRAELAEAVRHTAHFHGVTCTITLDPATGNRVNDPAALARCAGET